MVTVTHRWRHENYQRLSPGPMSKPALRAGNIRAVKPTLKPLALTLLTDAGPVSPPAAPAPSGRRIKSLARYAPYCHSAQPRARRRRQNVPDLRRRGRLRGCGHAEHRGPRRRNPGDQHRHGPPRRRHQRGHRQPDVPHHRQRRRTGPTATSPPPATPAAPFAPMSPSPRRPVLEKKCISLPVLQRAAGPRRRRQAPAPQHIRRGHQVPPAPCSRR